MNEPIILICMPADAPLMARGATFTSRCAKCQRPVMLAPSGQRFLKQTPQATILCTQCYQPESSDKPVKLAASEAELLAEVSGAVPNTFRNRN